MKNGALLFIGMLAALLLSWAGIVMGANGQLGGLTGYYDDADSQSYPLRQPGIASAGQLVYQDLNCAACHTQQVRREDFGSDLARGWGERQSVARDYIYQPAVQLGQSRFGPDLANLAGRKPTALDASDLYALLYEGHGAMPAYSFLFDERKVIGQVSEHALQLVGRYKALPGREIVPTRAAQELVAYLLSLDSAYAYPEAKPAAPAPGEKKSEEKK